MYIGSCSNKSDPNPSPPVWNHKVLILHLLELFPMSRTHNLPVYIKGSLWAPDILHTFCRDCEIVELGANLVFWTCVVFWLILIATYLHQSDHWYVCCQYETYDCFCQIKQASPWQGSGCNLARCFFLKSLHQHAWVPKDKTCSHV